jgi:hypothetical protein
MHPSWCAADRRDCLGLWGLPAFPLLCAEPRDQARAEAQQLKARLASLPADNSAASAVLCDWWCTEQAKEDGTKPKRTSPCQEAYNPALQWLLAGERKAAESDAGCGSDEDAGLSTTESVASSFRMEINLEPLSAERPSSSNRLLKNASLSFNRPKSPSKLGEKARSISFDRIPSPSTRSGTPSTPSTLSPLGQSAPALDLQPVRRRPVVAMQNSAGAAAPSRSLSMQSRSMSFGRAKAEAAQRDALASAGGHSNGKDHIEPVEWGTKSVSGAFVGADAPSQALSSRMSSRSRSFSFGRRNGGDGRMAAAARQDASAGGLSDGQEHSRLVQERARSFSFGRGSVLKPPSAWGRTMNHNQLRGGANNAAKVEQQAQTSKLRRQLDQPATTQRIHEPLPSELPLKPIEAVTAGGKVHKSLSFTRRAAVKVKSALSFGRKTAVPSAAGQSALQRARSYQASRVSSSSSLGLSAADSGSGARNTSGGTQAAEASHGSTVSNGNAPVDDIKIGQPSFDRDWRV